MGTYILCGGADRKMPDFARKLHEELYSRLDSIKLADVYFASGLESMQQRFDDYQPWFAEHFPTVERKLVTLDNYQEVMAWANVVYVHGGTTAVLLRNIQPLDDYMSLLKDKVHIGSSAGANYLSEHFLGHESIKQGLAVLPINLAVHYDADDHKESRSVKRTDELANMFPNVPTVRIREGEFEVIET